MVRFIDILFVFKGINELVLLGFYFLLFTFEFLLFK